MATRYAIQHRTSKRYVSAHPHMGRHAESPDAQEAVSWAFATEAELYRIEFADFAGAYEVVPVEVSSADDPSEAAE